MPSDGLQDAGLLVVTSSGGSVAFTFRARSLNIRNDGSGQVSVDITGGASVIATTSMSYPIKVNEELKIPGFPSRYYSGFSAIVGSGSTSATLRYIAWA